MHIPLISLSTEEVIVTKYRFKRAADGTIIVRAERVLGKQLVTSITRVVGPEEDLSAAMKQLYDEVQAGPAISPFAQGRASKREVRP